MHTPNPSSAAGWERWPGHLGNGQYLASLGQLWFKRKKEKKIQALITKRLHGKKGNWGWGFILAALGQVDLTESLGIELFQSLESPLRDSQQGISALG